LSRRTLNLISRFLAVALGVGWAWAGLWLGGQGETAQATLAALMAWWYALAAWDARRRR
jgi:hypothetical protein